MNINDAVKECITRRAWSVSHKISQHWQKNTEFRCFIAGGCLGELVNDVDLFPCEMTEVPIPTSLQVLVSTKNATTYKADPFPIQICT